MDDKLYDMTLKIHQEVVDILFLKTKHSTLD